MIIEHKIVLHNLQEILPVFNLSYICLERVFLREDYVGNRMVITHTNNNKDDSAA